MDSSDDKGVNVMGRGTSRINTTEKSVSTVYSYSDFFSRSRPISLREFIEKGAEEEVTRKHRRKQNLILAGSMVSAFVFVFLSVLLLIA